MKEIWDLYTENRAPTGRTHFRGDKIPDGCFHLVAHVWIVNARGEYLISQRAASKRAFPLKYESVGGAVLAGESALEGALREVKEEVGITLSPSCGELLFTEVRRQFSDIVDVWRFFYDGDADLSQATTDEVAKAAWMTVGEIAELFERGEFVGTLGYFFEKVAPAPIKK